MGWFGIGVCESTEWDSLGGDNSQGCKMTWGCQAGVEFAFGVKAVEGAGCREKWVALFGCFLDLGSHPGKV
jgi:hypothetical protein